MRILKCIFLDISNAFDKVRHERLAYKLQQNGISGNLLNILIHLLNSREQRVLLNGQSSNWVNFKAGIPQDSVMGTLHLNCLLYFKIVCG